MDGRSTELEHLDHRIRALEEQMEELGCPLGEEPRVAIPPGDFREYLLDELHRLRNELEIARLGLAFPPLWAEYLGEDDLELEFLDGPAQLQRAQDPQTPPEILKKLAGSSSLAVREAVARNRSTPPKVLASLMWDLQEELRWAAACNPRTPAEALRRGLEAEQGTVPELRVIPAALLQRLEILPEDLALWLALWKAANMEGRQKIQEHPYGRKVAIMAGLGGE